MNKYQIVIKSPTGIELKRLTKINQLVAGRTDKVTMPIEIVIPQILPPSYFSEDMIIELHRDNGTGTLTLDGETAYLLRDWEFYRTESGEEYIYLMAMDGNYIIDGREVEYDAGTTYADKSGVACDVIKEIVDENFVSATDTDRNISSAYFTVDSDDGLGASVTKSFSRQQVLSTIQNLVDQSRNAGTWITFDTVYEGSLPFIFKTYTNQRGNDLRDTITLSVEAKTLSNPRLKFNYVDAKTAAYMGGKGRDEARLVGTAVSDSATNTPFSRREIVSENFQVATEAALDNEARELLNKNRPKRTLTGKIASKKGLLYGRDWNFGDRVKATYKGYTFDCRINGYEINYSKSGDKTTDEVIAYILGEEEI